MTEISPASPRPAWRRLLQREPVMFVIMGGVNTIYGFGLFLVFELFMSYDLAYSLTYVIGIFVSYYFNARFVFRQPMRLKTLLSYPLVYVVQYLAGLVLLVIFVELFGIDARLAQFPTTILTLPITFLLSRAIVSMKPKSVTHR